jgi:putative FmdB family regulatory protein
MPVYQYACKNCHASLEIKQSFKDDALTRCPTCNQETLYRVIQPAGVVFKGSGWYVNDSKAKNPAAPATTDATAKPAEGTASPTTDTPAKSAESTPVTPAPVAETTKAPAPAAV